jgi:hypothetical protein
MPMSDRQREVCRERILKFFEDNHSIMFMTWDLGQKESKIEATEYLLKLFDRLELRPHEVFDLTKPGVTVTEIQTEEWRHCRMCHYMNPSYRKFCAVCGAYIA